MRQVAIHNVVDMYLNEYLLTHENPTVLGFIKYAEAMDEVENEAIREIGL